ncbi:ABC transporter permease [Facklamia sp. DSM 111018]|uniref:ABC transporter permease n=1 Tax=Facklamia lactis TaxID=2749967 RepID=A0ABS0LQ42_9LACT|nr:ABC transporter permease [Facklamia lactis]MBG9986275.1 ABC transporter permease [Facklamia lactis]
MSLKKIKQVLKEKPTYYIPIALLVLLCLSVLLAPLIPIDPNQSDVLNMNQPPSLKHIFGTDQIGRDYFIRVLYGGQISLLVGILAMLTSIIIGTSVGLISGYFGGVIDNILMRFIDVLSSIPWLVLVIVLSVYMKPGLKTIIIIIGCFSWMGIARLIRAETLSLKEREYVTYARFIKLPAFKIIIRHILPGVLPILIVTATGSIAGAIMTESTLSFLGLGIQPPYASWGSLLQNGQTILATAPHMALIPGVFIMLTIFSFNKIGDLFQEMIGGGN